MAKKDKKRSNNSTDLDQNVREEQRNQETRNSFANSSSTSEMNREGGFRRRGDDDQAPNKSMEIKTEMYKESRTQDENELDEADDSTHAHVHYETYGNEDEVQNRIKRLRDALRVIEEEIGRMEGVSGTTQRSTI